MKGLLLQIPLWLFIAWFAWHMRALRNRGRRSPFNENFLRLPGHTVRETQRDCAMDGILYMFVIIGAPFLFYSFSSENVTTNLLLFVVGMVVTVIYFVLCIKKFKKAIQLHLGVEAETATGQELSLLMRDGAWVFHDIPYQYGNIDHVVIGPGGVFTIETKGISKPMDQSRSGSDNATLSVENGFMILPHGKTRAPIEQALLQAKWLRREIDRRYGFKVPVRAVVAVPGWMVKGAFDGDCWVINPKRGHALRWTVTKPLVDSQTVTTIASWIEDLSRSIVPKSKEFDAKSELVT